MSPEVALFLAIVSALTSLAVMVFSIVLNRRARAVREEAERQARAVTVYSAAFGEIAKMTREAMSQQGDLTDYARGCRALAYEVSWELENCVTALRSEADSAP